MDVALTERDLVFAQEVRQFLAEKYTPALREANARQAGVFAEGDLAREWHAILHERGWIAPTWPKEYGGPGWTPMQRFIYERECGLVGTPSLPAMGIALCGPVIIHYGTQAQKDFFLPRMLSNEHYWCQGFSEPGSGSDLASLRTRAERDGDDYIVNGTKIWTTHAHEANWIFLLVRTGKDGPRQAGISFLLAPMDLPGITVTPILSMSGEHEVNQVFFDNVRVPAANLVGAENQGWEIAKFLLANERGGGSGASMLKARLERIKDFAQSQCDEAGQTLWNNPGIRDQIIRLEMEIMAIDWTEMRHIASLARGEQAHAAMPSMLKLMVSETSQKVAHCATEVLGPYAMVDQRRALGLHPAQDPVGPLAGLTLTARYLNARASTIYGGSSEIQRSIIARSLGL